MYQISRKRVNLSLEEKLWIIRKNKEHKKNSQTRLALDFSVKFKRPITRSCICKTLNKSEEILALATKNPELETKKAFKLQKLTLAEFESELHEELERVYRRANLTYEIIKLVGESLQSTQKYSHIEDVTGLKFSKNYISRFMSRHALRTT